MTTSFKSTIASLDSLKGEIKLPATQLPPLSPPSSTKAPSLAGSDVATEPVEDYNGNYKVRRSSAPAFAAASDLEFNAVRPDQGAPRRQGDVDSLRR